MSTRTGVSFAIACLISTGSAPRVGVAWAQPGGVAAWEQQIADHPDDERAYEGYAMAAIGAGRYDDAITRLRSAVDRMPRFGRGYYLLGVAYRSNGEHALAAACYRRCIELGAQVNDARYGLARALAADGDKRGAIEALSRYVNDERDPQKARYVETARAELAALRKELARAASPGALRAEADKLKAAGRLEEAVASYRLAIEAEPDDALLRNELGTALFALKRYIEAAEAFAAATERDGTYAVAWFNLGSALRKAERHAEAVRAGMRYVELLPADPDGWYGLAQSRDAAGDDRGAADAYRRFLAIESRPSQQRYVTRAREALSSIESRQRAGAMGLKPIDRDDVLPMGAAGPRDLRDPFDLDATADPDAPGNALEPYAPTPPSSAPGADGPTGGARTREYLAALGAYRRALAAQLERVTTRYEKGAALAVAGKGREAAAAWDAVTLEDAQVTAARRQIEKLREKK